MKTLLIFILLIIPSFASAEGRVLDKVLAEVDGEPITTSELNKFLASRDVKASISSEEETLAALQQLVARRLISHEARRSGISVSGEDVDTYINEIQKQNSVDRKTLTKMLKEQGLSFDAYRLQVEGDILRARVLASQVRNKINIVEEDIQRFLEKHPERRPEPGQVLLERLTFKSCDTASSHLERVKQGGHFVDKHHKKYKNLGYVNVSDLREEFATAVNALEIDQVSEVLDVLGSCYIFKVLYRQGEDGVVDQRLKDDIRRELFEVRYKESAEKFLAQELPKRYFVDYKIASR